MTDRDFEIGSLKFKLNKVDAFKQFHIVRRLAPILGDIIPVAQKLKNANLESKNEDEKFDSIAKLMTPIMQGLSKLSDADADFVLLGLCSTVEMQQISGNWARIVVNGNLMFHDLELPLLLQIAGKAFAFNLAGFFSAAPQVSHGQK